MLSEVNPNKTKQTKTPPMRKKKKTLMFNTTGIFSAADREIIALGQQVSHMIALLLMYSYIACR